MTRINKSERNCSSVLVLFIYGVDGSNALYYDIWLLFTFLVTVKLAVIISDLVHEVFTALFHRIWV